MTGVRNPARPPLAARAFALRGNVDEEPIVWVSVDVAGISRQMHLEIIDALAIDGARVAIACSHTHASSFGAGPIPEILYPALRNDAAARARITAAQESLKQTLVALIEDVRGPGVTPIELYHRTGTFTSTRNRISALPGYVPPSPDQDAPVLYAVRTADRSPFAIVFGANAHPRTDLCPYDAPDCVVEDPSGAELPSWTEELHPDYPGVAAREIELALKGVTAVFVQGCAGDQDAAGNPSGSDAGDHSGERAGRLARVESRGSELATSVITSALAAAADPAALLEGPIRAAQRTIRLPLDYGQDCGTATRPWIVTRARLREIYASSSFTGCGDARFEHARYMLSLPELPLTVPFPYLMWTIGVDDPLLWIGLSGEVVAHYALELRAHFSASARPWVSAYVNEVHSYVPSALMRVAAQNAPASHELIYHAGWRATGETYQPAGYPPMNVTPAVAAGNLTYYGIPCRYRVEVESRILSDTQALGELLVQISSSCSDAG